MMEKNLKEFLIKEIEVVQDIIKRMAFNSFMIKGWAITLIVVVLLFQKATQHIFLAFIPLISFWFLDAYFLRLERMYRKLYEWIIKNRLKTDEYLFDMNPYRFKKEVPGIIRTMFSITLAWFYLSIAVMLAIYWIIVH